MASEPISVFVLWPDPDRGPWHVRVWWRPQHGAAVPVGIEITSWVDPHEDREFREALGRVLPQADDDVEFPAIGSQFMKSLPVGQLFALTREALLEVIGLDAPPDGWDGHDFDTNQAILREEYEPAFRNGPRSGRDLGADHYRAVAQVYSDAARAGRPPTKAVAERFTLSTSAAAKQVARARARGLLPPTTRGRVGKLTEEL